MAPDIAHCSLHIAHCSLWGKSPRGGSWSQSAVNKPWRLSMNLAIRTGRSLGPSDLRFTIYDLRVSDGVIAALRDSHARRSARRGARKSYIVNRRWLRDRRRSGSSATPKSVLAHPPKSGLNILDDRLVEAKSSERICQPLC